MILNWLLSHLACGFAAMIAACVMVELYRPKSDA